MRTYSIRPFSPLPVGGMECLQSHRDFRLNLEISSPEDVTRVAHALKARRVSAHDRPLRETLDALDQLGHLWGDKGSPWRQEALEILPALSCQSRRMIQHELDMIAQILWRRNLEDWIARELGSLDILEGWVEVGEVMVHRQPRGLVFHNLAGNAFILPVLSILFTLLSKNVALLKVSTEEPYFGVRFAESLAQIDPDLAHDLAVLYWPGESSETYDALFRSGLGVVVAWGEAATVREMALRAARYRVHFVDHGPKFGLEVIQGPGRQEARSLAYNVALDIVPWEQGACLSPRVIFVQDGEVEAEEFARLLSEEMEQVSQELPNDKIDCCQALPVLSNREYYLIQLEMAGKGRLFASEGSKWTVVYSTVMPTGADLNHCQGRFVIVSRIEALSQVLEFLDENRLGPYLQTMAYQGGDLEFIEGATLRGISDVTLPGQVNVKPFGSSHDGLYNLAELTYVTSRKRTEVERSIRIDWEEKVLTHFEGMLRLTPPLFREVARETISEVADATAKQRGADRVEEWDLVHAYLQETPEVFKPLVMENAISVGIDMERYLTRERILQMQDLSAKIAWDQVQRQFHPDVTWFEWCITSRCNLRCRYCYEEGAEDGMKQREGLGTPEALQIIHSLGQASQELQRQFVICWSGGEPLLRADLLELVECARGEGILNSLATNGTLLTPQLAERLRELEVSNVLISVDSVEPEIHDRLRGKGSHARALQAIEACKKAGLLILVESVATRHNWQEVDRLKRWAEEEVGAFFFCRPALQLGRGQGGDLLMSPKEYQDLYSQRNREVFDKLEKGKGRQIPLFSIFDMVPFPHSPASSEECDYLEWGVGCQACRLLHGISLQGDLLPCIRFKFPLGNLLQESFQTISEKELYQRISLRRGRDGICADCEHLRLCGGGCLAEVMALEGDPFAGWSRCWFSRPRKE